MLLLVLPSNACLYNLDLVVFDLSYILFLSFSLRSTVFKDKLANYIISSLKGGNDIKYAILDLEGSTDGQKIYKPEELTEK